MTTKRERSDRFSTDPATKLRGGFYLGLNDQEAKTLKHSLITLSRTGMLNTEQDLIIRSIYHKLNASLLNSNESLNDSNHQQQLRELKQTLHEFRRKLNDLEERIEDLEVGDMLV